MPKGKRKGKSDRHHHQGRFEPSTSDEESVNDNASVVSFHSDASRSQVGEEIETNETETISQQEIFEEKLIEAIDGMVQKSAQGRSNCFEAVCTAFVKKYMPDFVADRRVTLCDNIERSLKKGRDAEQILSARLATLLCIQLGTTQFNEEICNCLRPLLQQFMNDRTISCPVRAKCCHSLALVMFLCGGEIAEVIHVMRDYENLFCESYLRSDRSVPTITADLSHLHAAALSSWSLLLTLIAPNDVYTFLNDTSFRNFAPSLIQLSEMLLSPHLDVRLTAGEALALAYEIGRDFNENFGEIFIEDLLEMLRQLATDSHKYRAKRDRKQQRATFRDVLHWIEEGEPTVEQIRLSTSTTRETLVLDSWVRRRQYEALCNFLGSGIHAHLMQNDLLRDVFEMGAKPVYDPNNSINSKQSKNERQILNAANFKARTITRGKNRSEKRTEDLNDY